MTLIKHNGLNIKSKIEYNQCIAIAHKHTPTEKASGSYFAIKCEAIFLFDGKPKTQNKLYFSEFSFCSIVSNVEALVGGGMSWYMDVYMDTCKHVKKIKNRIKSFWASNKHKMAKEMSEYDGKKRTHNQKSWMKRVQTITTEINQSMCISFENSRPQSIFNLSTNPQNLANKNWKCWKNVPNFGSFGFH